MIRANSAAAVLYATANFGPAGLSTNVHVDFFLS